LSLLLILTVTNFALSSCSQDDELESIDLADLSSSLIEWQIEQGYTPCASLSAAVTDLTDLTAVDVSDVVPMRGGSGRSEQPHQGDCDAREREEFMEWKRYKALHAKFGSS
jgi:hypothetical protein